MKTKANVTAGTSWQSSRREFRTDLRGAALQGGFPTYKPRAAVCEIQSEELFQR
jgi:hypothetical protein